MPNLKELTREYTECQDWQEPRWGRNNILPNENIASSEMQILPERFNVKMELFNKSYHVISFGSLDDLCNYEIENKSTRKMLLYFDKKYKENIKDDQINEIIAEASKYLTYTENWDDEGSPGYTISTLNRTRNVLSKYEKYIWKKYKSYAIMPEINPGPNGSFDLYWKSMSRSFLLNVPADNNNPITYYGEGEKGNNSIKGTLDDKSPSECFFEWIYYECSDEIRARDNIG